MKKKTRKKVVRRKRRVVRRNPGVKKGWALVRRGGFGGVEMTVVSTHQTKQGAETAMIRKGFNPGEMDNRYKAIQFGPGTGYEYLNTEFTGKFLRPIVGNRRRGLVGNNSMSERYKKQSKRYLVTKKFTSGYMKGMTIVDESPVPLYVGFKPSKPYFGSPYIVTKTQVNFTGKRNLLPNSRRAFPTPRQQKMLDFLKRVYPQYSELAKDSATKKDASRLARLKLIKVRSFKRTGTSRGKRFSMMIMEARAMAPKGGQLSSPYLGLARNPSGPVTEGEVRLMFETHGIPLAEKGIFGSGYNALSQYGSVLKDSFKTADEAEEYTVKFYKMRPGLVRQDGSYRKAFRKARGLRRNGVMADAENEFLMKYGLTPDQARSKFFAMIGSSFEKAQKLSFEEKVKIRDAYEVFKKKLLKAKMSMRRR